MRTRLWNIVPRLALGLLGGWLIMGPQAVLADDYDIFVSSSNTAGSDSDGTGGFSGFTNPGTPGSNNPIDTPQNDLTVVVINVPLTIPGMGTIILPSVTFTTMVPGGTPGPPLNVVVEPVDYNDGKDNEKYGANQITGNYVEGLSGVLTSTGSGRYELRFTFNNGGSGDPSQFNKKCEIWDIAEEPDKKITTSCDYQVQNAATTIPEPGTLALLGLGLAAAAATRRRQRRKTIDRSNN